VALRLRELGLPGAFALAGGLDAWKQARHPLEPLGRQNAATNTAHHQPM
jgi:3-mercaptopyruvate sulfurtransferase SseA